MSWFIRAIKFKPPTKRLPAFCGEFFCVFREAERFELAFNIWVSPSQKDSPQFVDMHPKSQTLLGCMFYAQKM